MTDQVFAREISPGHWQWASCDERGAWYNNAYQSGDSEAMATQLADNTPVRVVLRGQQVVATEVEIDSKQQKHAAKLIPFELEDELSSSVDDLHFAFVRQEESSTTSVLYANKQRCLDAINDVADQGCDVSTALPDYLLLTREQGEIVMLLEAAVLTVRLSEHWGFSIEQELASAVLARIAKHPALSASGPEKLKLVAATNEELQQLESLLPEAWQSLEKHKIEGGFWDLLDTQVGAAALNLRRGSLSRQLPFKKWWTLWKLPTIVFAIAFGCALLVNVFALFEAKSQESFLREEINRVYLEVVPNGRLGDVEGILTSKLQSVRTGTTEATNANYLLSKTVSAIDEVKDLTVTSFSYNGDQRALQLTIEFKTLDLLTQFRSALSKLGVETDSPRTTSLGDQYQARIKLQEAN